MWNGGAFFYQYYIKDHPGNIRALMAERKSPPDAFYKYFPFGVEIVKRKFSGDPEFLLDNPPALMKYNSLGARENAVSRIDCLVIRNKNDNF